MVRAIVAAIRRGVPRQFLWDGDNVDVVQALNFISTPDTQPQLSHDTLTRYSLRYISIMQEEAPSLDPFC
jgi:hypothetical protein